MPGLHCQPATSGVVLCCSSSTAHYPEAVRQNIAGVPVPNAPSRQALSCRSCTAHCPQAAKRCIAAEVPLPITPGIPDVYCRGSSAHNPDTAWHYVVGLPLPPSRSARAHSRLPASPWAVWRCLARHPLPTAQGTLAQRCRSSMAHSPRALQQCTAMGLICTAHRQRGSLQQEFHCRLPKCGEAMRGGSSTAH